MQDTNPTVKILLIEENEVIRLYIRDAFWLHAKVNEYEVVMAPDLEKARVILADPQSHFDLIFLDLVLHDQRKGRIISDPAVGLDLITKIRAMPNFATIKIVIFSSPAYFGLWRKAKRLGANYFLKKDEYLPHHLVDWVEQILGKGAAK